MNIRAVLICMSRVFRGKVCISRVCDLRNGIWDMEYEIQNMEKTEMALSYILKME
jgi:hypothetical protein